MFTIALRMHMSALQAEASLPDSKVTGSFLTPNPESPDSPLVFPWSQGPNSTGAASAYASLSDSYLSRPPSQTPSRAPSPSKHAQHGPSAAAMLSKHAQQNGASQSPSPKHAQLAFQSSAAQHANRAQHAAGTLPSHRVKRPFESMLDASGSHSPSAMPGFQLGGSPMSQSGSPSGPALPIGPAFQADSKEPLSSGPVSVAPWRRPTSASPTARPHSPQLSSLAMSTTHLPPKAPHTSLEYFPSTRSWPQLSALDADIDIDPEQAVSRKDLPSMQQQQQQQSPTNGIMFPRVQQDNDFTGVLPVAHSDRMSRNDVTSLASSSSHDLAASSAGATLVDSAAVHAAPQEGQSTSVVPPLRKGTLLMTSKGVQLGANRLVASSC